jgi:hypothetical protein
LDTETERNVFIFGRFSNFLRIPESEELWSQGTPTKRDGYQSVVCPLIPDITNFYGTLITNTVFARYIYIYIERERERE